MQSRAPEGRSIVSISATGAISIDPTAGSLQQTGGAPRSQPAAAATASVLNQITEAFQGLFSSAGPGGALSQGPSLFSAAGPSSTDSLTALRGTLDDLSRKLSTLLNGASAPNTSAPAPATPITATVHTVGTVTPLTATAQPATAPAAASSTPQVNPDWPYPDLGSHPFVENPTGSGPGGTFNFNPTYFATEDTAKAIANMMGGKVVQQVAFLNGPGSPFVQNQMNNMVQLPDGKIINPGIIAQAISLKQPRTLIDATIYAEVNQCLVTPGSAPVFVPVNPPLTSSTPPPAATASAPTQQWSGLDQLATHAPLPLQSNQPASDPDSSAVNQQMQAILKMVQLLARMASAQQSMQPNIQSRRSVSL